MRTRAEISAEVEALIPEAAKYDTAEQTNVTILAAGAHDALRWALGLADVPISQNLAQRWGDWG